MISACHEERELLCNDAALITRVLLHECANCGITVRITVPPLEAEAIEAPRL